LVNGRNFSTYSGTPTYITALNEGPADDIRDVLEMLDEVVDVPSFRAARATFAAKGYNTAQEWGGVIARSSGDSEDARDVVLRMSQSCEAMLYFLGGKVAIAALNWGSVPSGELAHYHYNQNIIQGSWRAPLLVDRYNIARAFWKRRFKPLSDAGNYFEENACCGVATSIQELKGEFPAPAIELDFVRGDTMAEAVSLIQLRKLASVLAHPTFDVKLVGLQSLPTDIAYVTHPEVPSSDGTGFVKEPVIIERVAAGLSPDTVQIQALQWTLINDDGWFEKESEEPGGGGGGGEPEYTYNDYTIYPNRDAMITEFIPDLNRGDATHILLGSAGPGADLRGLMGWSIPTLAGNAEVIQAIITVYVYDISGATHIKIYKLYASFVEMVVTWNTMGPWHDGLIGPFWGETPIAMGSREVTLNSTGRGEIKGHSGGIMYSTFQSICDIWKCFGIHSREMGGVYRPKLWFRTRTPVT